MRRLVLVLACAAIVSCGGHDQSAAPESCADSGHNSHAVAREQCGYAVVRRIGPARRVPKPRHAACVTRRTAVFYAASDWLSLGEGLAQHSDPCTDYLISIPPLQAKDGTWTLARPDEAALIRRLGPGFHALDEIRVDAWRPWLALHPGKTWFEAGALARRRMVAAGYDSWAVNELMLPIASDPAVRSQMAHFARGLAADGTKGIVFHVAPLQAAAALGDYRDQVKGWLSDGAFWAVMAHTVSLWAEEVYVDARSCCVPGATLAQRAGNANEYLQHLLVLARAGPAEARTAAAFLERSYVPLGNAAWQWTFGFGNTSVDAAEMGRLVAQQAYAMHRFSRTRPIGFAWAPRPRGDESRKAFVAETRMVLGRLVRAVHTDACGRDGAYCRCSVPGARFGTGWAAFARW